MSRKLYLYLLAILTLISCQGEIVVKKHATKKASSGGASVVRGFQFFAPNLEVLDINLNPGNLRHTSGLGYLEGGVEFGGYYYYSPYSASKGTELYRYDISNKTYEFIQDIFPGTSSSKPIDFIEASGKIYFNADNLTEGKELWVFDPAVAISGTNPQIVRDIRPGAADSDPEDFIEVGGKIYFKAEDGVTGQEIWVFDPAVAVSGTNPQLVQDSRPGLGGILPFGFVELLGKIYFTAHNGTDGYEFWVYDPAVATSGTNPQMLRDIRTGAASSTPARYTVVLGKLYFRANDGTNGDELWVYDPAVAVSGTNPQMVRDINPGVGSSSLEYFVEYAGKLYFRATDGTNGTELWVYDPAVAVSGTNPEMIQNLNPGAASSSPTAIIEASGKIYFRANDGTNGNELWVYNPVDDSLNPQRLLSTGDFDANYLQTIGGQACFVNLSLNSQSRVVECADPNTNDVSNMYSGMSSLYTSPSDPVNFTELSGKLYFTANDGVNGAELWVYDPTMDASDSNPQILRELVPGSGSTSPGSLRGLSGKLYFKANDGVNGNELWVYDPAIATSGTNPQMVRDIAPGSSSPSQLAAVSGKLYFAANDGVNGNELWVYDPAVATSGTNPQMVRDIRAGAASSTPTTLVEVSGKIYFRANEGTNGNELWVYDPAVATSGTNPQIVRDIRAGGGSSTPTELTALSGKLYFRANDGVSGNEPWVYDPAVATSGTNPQILRDILVGGGHSSPVSLRAVLGKLYFRANDGVNGTEPWVFDPALAISGTNPQMLIDLNVGAGSSGPVYFTELAGDIYFRASGATTGSELWIYDPAVATSGTNPQLIHDINTGVPGSSPAYLTEFLGKLYFSADNDTFGAEVYRYTPP